MPSDKYSALWVSHSSINDFLRCPRAYYLKNIYRNPQTNRKIQIMTPPLALGSAVHTVIESLSILPTESRFNTPLTDKLEIAWKKVTGKLGGFTDKKSEDQYKDRARAMLKRVSQHPGPLARQAVKIKEELPQFWLSEEDSIMLCGKIDWLEYLPDTDSVHIIDFKTSKHVERTDSLQLPIYHLLVHYCQKRAVEKASYWYLELSDTLEEKPLPDLVEAQKQVLDVAKQMKLAKSLDRFKCPQGEDGCSSCRPMEAVLRGEAEYVGEGSYRQDVYVLHQDAGEDEEESVIL